MAEMMSRMDDDESPSRMPVPEPPGIGDDLMDNYSAIGGRRAAPGPSTIGAANPQLTQALNLLITATQLDPDVSDQLSSCIRVIIQLITNRQHVSVPLGPSPMPGAIRKPPEIPTPFGGPTGSPLAGAMSPFMKTMAGGV